ncbi:aarF domain-containing kinase [Raphidocelis subcapitata]|uniref:AarF domain-containing kinase n=1 Tax=Raphidocelis subcapitata TaxID=307507 RepID=A0A2V0PI81_9CHLO|nr:aarF domain-containing kinase [Raphidocelis subcapitata]|eukprot:GBF99518.1 aarF domain-containing kinase [Raphidocelis subcapitata]
MSWLTPKHLEDASRVLRGVALVLARAAADSPALRRVGAGEHQQGLRATAELLQSQAERARLSAAQIAAAAAEAAASARGGAGAGAGAASAAAPLAWAAERLSTLSAALGGGGEQQAAAPANPLVSYIFPQTADMFAQAGPHGAAAAAAAQLPQQLLAQAAAAAESLAGAPPEQLLRGAQQVLAQQAERLSAAAAAYQAAGAGSSSSSTSSSIRQQPEAQPQQTDWRAGPAPSAPAHATANAAPASTSSSTAPESSSTGTTTSSSSSSSSQGSTAETAAPAAAAGREAVGEWPSGHDDAGLLKAEECAPPRAAAAAAAAGAAPPEGAEEPARPVLRERRVPSTPIGRAFGFASMGASLLLGTLKDNIVGSFSSPSKDTGAAGSSSGGGGGGGAFSIITESNAERLAAALCRMRGAALKLGQMLSIQDETVLPPQIQAALERVRQGADVMPRAQLEGQLRSQLGRDWAAKIEDFEWAPRAAASIGQVHSAVLKDGRRVAMKIQYPGVARSIESDVDNLMRLIAVANVLPRGLFVENAARVAKRELKLECDYEYEARCQARFKQLVEGDGQLAGDFHVPGVVPELSAAQVLTSEWVEGYAIDKVRQLDQGVRDEVGTRLLRLTLRELFGWRFMQTDPNWGNFLYDPATGVLNLIDFGAARAYPKPFVDDYLRMVRSCAERDRDGVIRYSTRLGFLTGDESAVMLDAHSEAGFVVGLPFAPAPGPPAGGFAPYDFGSHAGMTARVGELGSVMLRHRLTAPPEESYSLHRKLSGAFLACMKLRARVPCRRLFYDAYDSHGWGPEADGGAAAGAGEGVAAMA